MKASARALVLAAVVLALAPAAALAQDSVTIGYAVMGYDHPLFQAMKRGADAGAKEAGVELQAVDGKFDVSLQNSQIEDFISKKVDALLVNPVTAKEVVPTLEKAKAAGIPVVAIDTRPVGFEPDAFVTMNHYQGGYTIGWKIAKDLNCEGNYAVIWAAGNEQAASRLRGLKAGMQEYCKVTGQEYAMTEEGQYSGITGPLRETSRKITETLLTKYPEGELSFVFGQTDEFANGAYLATQAKGRDDVLVYGMDNNEDMRSFIGQNKNLVATVAHLPVEVGAIAVKTAADLVNDEDYLKEIQLNFRLVDQDNVDLDPGWEGSYEATFSDFVAPEQLDDGGASATATAATTSASKDGGSSGANVILVIVAALLAMALVATLLWARRQRKSPLLGPPAR